MQRSPIGWIVALLLLLAAGVARMLSAPAPVAQVAQAPSAVSGSAREPELVDLAISDPRLVDPRRSMPGREETPAARISSTVDMHDPWNFSALPRGRRLVARLVGIDGRGLQHVSALLRMEGIDGDRWNRLLTTGFDGTLACPLDTAPAFVRNGDVEALQFIGDVEGQPFESRDLVWIAGSDDLGDVRVELVPAAVGGQVVDEDGQAIEGATVKIALFEAGAWRELTTSSTVTDERGDFLLFAAPAESGLGATLGVQAVHFEGRRSSGYARIFHGQVGVLITLRRKDG